MFLNYANIMILTLLYFIYQMFKFETPRLLSYFISLFIFLTGLQLAHTRFLLNPCRFVPVSFQFVVDQELISKSSSLGSIYIQSRYPLDCIIFLVMLFISNFYLYWFCIVFLSFSYFNYGLYILISMSRHDRKSVAIFLSLSMF